MLAIKIYYIVIIMSVVLTFMTEQRYRETHGDQRRAADAASRRLKIRVERKN